MAKGKGGRREPCVSSQQEATPPAPPEAAPRTGPKVAPRKGLTTGLMLFTLETIQEHQ